MKKKQALTGIVASIGMLILILDGKTALNGAREGIDLCLKTVIPSLFPFCFLSILLTSAFSGASSDLLRPIGAICRLPAGAEHLLLSGFLGGYPVGAQCIAQAYEAGQLSKQDAERMLGFCNNAGPAFLFGMVSILFSQNWIPWALWGIHIISAVITAVLLPGSAQPASPAEKRVLSPTQALVSAVRVMAIISGWVILFRIILGFLKRWILWLFPITLQAAITGILELSNGCCELMNVQSETMRFIICSGTLAFGGLCVTMQTIAVTNRLSLRYYIGGKLLQTLFSLLLSYSIIRDIWFIPVLLILLLLLTPIKMQKKSSIQAPVGV